MIFYCPLCKSTHDLLVVDSGDGFTEFLCEKKNVKFTVVGEARNIQIGDLVAKSTV